MALDTYSTAVLNAVVDSLFRVQTALLTMFFPNIQQSDSETIKFDVMDGKRRIAPFVHPTMAGKMVEGLGFTTKDFEPAYVKDKRIFDPDRALKRQAGERIGGGATPASRLAANLARELSDQQDMLNRRYELMAAEIMRTGKVTIAGDGYPTVVVDFLRNAAHTVTLTSGDRWGQAGVVPTDLIEAWSTTMLKNSGAEVTDVIMSPDAWILFIDDQKSKDLMTFRRITQGTIGMLANGGALGLEFHGNIGSKRYWTYQDWYVDDSGTEQPMLAANTVLLGSQHMQGVRHFGAIKDEAAGFQARESFTKSWTVEDPSVRFLLTQSAPIMVPYRPDASFAAVVN